jgi:nickel/cobalt transporter (NicO) family protein
VRIPWQLVAALVLVMAQPAVAHPLGNFTINHLAKVRVEPHGVSIRYIVDMAEIPTFQVMAVQSIKEWGHDEVRVIENELTVVADGKPLTLVASVPRVSTRKGAGGLPTLYFVDEFQANTGARPPHTLSIADDTYAGRIGWKDIVVAPDTEPTNELRSYPNALLGSPRSITAVSIDIAPNGRITARSATSETLTAPAGTTSQVRSNYLSDMLARGVSNPLIVLLTCLIAIGLGALHALEPGHGKTLLAVSLVGARATMKQAFVLASALTIAHTAGVFALGVLLMTLAHWIVPESVYPWMTLFSGVLIAGLGASALARLNQSHGHSHAHDPNPSSPVTFRSAVLIAMSGNIAPCPAALVVLLAALALHQVAYGMLVVVAFSVGLAAVLTVLGFAVVRGTAWLSQRRGFERFVRIGPLVTATAISLIGGIMLSKAAAALFQVPGLLVGALVLAAIAGYAMSPHHSHSHDHAHAVEEPT